MQLEEALHQIREIRGQLVRSETFRGTRAVSVAATGVVAIAAAALQPVVVPMPEVTPLAFLGYWIAVATLAVAIGGAQLLDTYVASRSAHERATTRAVLGQFLPPIGAGALVTAVVTSVDPAFVRWLPGLWAIFTGLGLFAARPFLPKAIGFVALGYLFAGTLVLLFRRGDEAFHPWVMGATFGLGQLAGALVLFWNIERKEPLRAAEA